jgi:glycosyltransferase involved in cell wall biosynthesis
MQVRSAELAEFTKSPGLSGTALARDYAVLSAEYGALRAEYQTLQHACQGRRWRWLNLCRRAIRGSVRLSRAIWRLLFRWHAGNAGFEHEAQARASLACAPYTNAEPAFPRVVYIGDRGPYEAASMRYRAHNLVETLTLHGTAATFVAEEDLPVRLAEVLAHDLIVLVRRRWNPRIKSLIEAARLADIPLVFDLDDFLFDPWVLPYIDSARGALASWTVQYIKEFRATLLSCDYFTGATRFLVEQAAHWGRPGWVVRNGLNKTQLHCSHALLEQSRPAAADGKVRIGYFSGTKTHQADFRIAYPALVRALQDCPQARLVVVGELDLQEFPGLEPFAAQIEKHPCVDWRDLPALIATVDINLVPLELNPYTQGKSELKYFEAGILKVPTIASPTQVFASAIEHGVTGWLAASDDDWYRALHMVMADTTLRRRLGENAHAHALRNYGPAAVAAEARSAFEQILHAHRARRDVAA